MEIHGSKSRKTSVRLKFVQSTNNSGKGRIYFQIIRSRWVRQFNPEIKIPNSLWLGNEENPYTSDDDVNKEIDWFFLQIEKCINILEYTKPEYTADDVVKCISDISQSLVNYIMKISDRLSLSGRETSSKHYSSLCKRITEFIGNSRVSLQDIDCDFVESFESFLLSRKMKRNSSSFYLRMLRSVWHKAMDSGLVTPTLINPFKHVYTGVDVTEKRAISIDDINKINRLNLKAHPNLDFARDMFMFSLYTRGMNFADMYSLKKDNIQNDVITYKRRKTGKILHIKMEKKIKKIIDKYLRPDSDYVFYISTSRNIEYKSIANKLSNVNANLKKIAEYAGIKSNLTMYVARHSWATIAQNDANVPLSVISKSMGHSDEKVTQIYLSSFGNKSIDDANRSVIRLLK